MLINPKASRVNVNEHEYIELDKFSLNLKMCVNVANSTIH